MWLSTLIILGVGSFIQTVYGQNVIIDSGFRPENYFQIDSDDQLFDEVHVIPDGSSLSIKSPNYPNPYPGPYEQVWNILVGLGTGIEIGIKFLDLDRTKDFILIRPGSANATNERGKIYSGLIEEPLIIRSLETYQISITFSSGQENDQHSHKGFELVCRSFGETFVPTETPTTVIPILDQPLQFSLQYLIIPRVKQVTETWEILRLCLMDMANLYINEKKLPLKPITDEINSLKQIVFKTITNCPRTWRHFETCIEIDFAIFVVFLSKDEIEAIENNDFIDLKTEYELSRRRLEEMWDNYAEPILAFHGIQLYNNSNTDIILIWVGISLAIVGLFLLVLYGIWRIDVPKDSNRKPNTYGDSDRKSELDKDVSMEPNPYQLKDFPNLFQDTKVQYESPVPSPNRFGDVQYRTTQQNIFDIYGDNKSKTKEKLRVQIKEPFRPYSQQSGPIKPDDFDSPMTIRNTPDYSSRSQIETRFNFDGLNEGESNS